MAFRKFRGVRRLRPKRKGAWTGLGVVNYVTTANLTYSWYLWDDLASQRLNLAGKGVHQRTLLWWSFSRVGTTGMTQPMSTHVAMTIGHYKTSYAGTVSDSMIINPLGWDGAAYNLQTQLFEHDLMYYDMKRIFFQFPTTSGSVIFNSRDVNFFADVPSKRRIDDTDAILVSFSAQHDGAISFSARTYVTW